MNCCVNYHSVSPPVHFFIFKRINNRVYWVWLNYFLTKTTIMNSQKFFLGGIAGGVVFFLLGWVSFGMLLKDFFASNGRPGPADGQMVWWALALGNLLLGFLLAYILGKANIVTAGGGAATGFVIGLLMSVGINLIMYATATTPIPRRVYAVDAATLTVMWTIAGAIVGWVRGMGSSKPAMA